METITEAKQYLRVNFEKGVECPCCTQFVKLYRHRLNSQMAKTLIEIYNISSEENREWIHVLNEIKPSNRMYSLMRFWDLIVAAEYDQVNSYEDKKASGYWKITERGEKFVNNEINISKYVYLFNNRKYSISEETISIHEALGKKFSYSELMQ